MRVLGVAGCLIATFLSASPVVAAGPKLFARNAGAVAVPRIAGGEVVDDADFRFVAYIQGYTSENGSTTCTGSLIAPNIVLTAAHCTFATSTTVFDASDYKIGFNHSTPSLTSDFEGYSVAKVSTHPNFNHQTLANDMVLLFLKDSVPSSVADTVKIYTGNISAKDELFAAGFGITEPENSTSMATQLMSVELTVGNDTFCSENSHSYDPKYLICTDGTPGKDTCAGDSGGPLAKQIDGGMALAGITSYAPVTDSNPDGLCAQAGSSGYYVHVNAYLPWITKVTGLNEADITIGGLQDSSSSESESEVYDESSSEQTTDNSGEKFSSTISNASSSASGAVSSSASSYDYGSASSYDYGSASSYDNGSASSYDNGSASSYDNGSASSHDNGSESKYDSGDMSSYIGSESESTDEWVPISSYSVTDTELGGLSDDSSFDESSYSDNSLAESNGTSETEDSSSFDDLSTDEDINSDLFFTDESVYSSDSDSESSEIIFSSASYPYVDNGNNNDPELEHLSEGDTGKAAMLEPSFKLAISFVGLAFIYTLF
ncbi:hypothetical protein IWW54_002907 [Coemansia sp. RSA 2705]|nr:hypothetical protein IWW54_002907 [Coemansia sp. RSA 2705]